MQHTILVLAANPTDTKPLRLDQEVRDIREGLQRAQQRDAFKLETRHALRAQDLRRALLEVKPTIVHFSGHGEGLLGLMLEDPTGKAQAIPNEALGSLLSLFKDKIQCVLLNACYSRVQAEVITQYIPYVIGMSEAISDKAALEYAVAFYDALGAGESFEFAHQLGVTAIGLAGIKGAEIPVLLTNTALLKPVVAEPVTRGASTSSLSVRNHELLLKKLELLQRQRIMETRVEEQMRLDWVIEETQKLLS
ncbi:MAG: CHAT domain-containing protein [Thiofilum sp.]|uniref:CHAT domain-containing protein n=1 Tax=Thiofilum sp. TaxID=2212733 RepID=UPI0025D51D4F|nr:CHAT domain-containing protein [Thiofilum sp.]MBK8454903.1 CHAT domain-containing protein [Thiofilum sp.]